MLCHRQELQAKGDPFTCPTACGLPGLGRVVFHKAAAAQSPPPVLVQYSLDSHLSSFPPVLILLPHPVLCHPYLFPSALLLLFLFFLPSNRPGLGRVTFIPSSSSSCPIPSPCCCCWQGKRFHLVIKPSVAGQKLFTSRPIALF